MNTREKKKRKEKMDNINATEEAKKVILDKIAEKLVKKDQNIINALRHGAHGSCHASHGSHVH